MHAHYPHMPTHTANTARVVQNLHQQLHKYIIGTRSYLEMEAANQSDYLDDLRVNFCIFIADLTRNMWALDNQQTLLTEEMRTDLFALFVNYCDVFRGVRDITKPTVANAVVIASPPNLDLGLAALDAVAALCCGPAFDKELSLRQPAYLRSFLESMLCCSHRAVRTLAGTAIQALLTHNRTGAEAGLILEWTLAMCYASQEPAARQEAFQALAHVLSSSADLGMGIVPGLCAAVHAIAHSDPAARECGRQLVSTLTERFYGPQQRLAMSSTLANYHPAQHSVELDSVSAALAARYPQHTLGIFLEFAQRFRASVPASQRVILRCLLPWLRQMDLVSELGHNKLGCHPDVVFR